MGGRQKTGAGVGVLGLAQGFASLALTYSDPTPNETLARWLLVGAAACVAASLGLFFWPRTNDADGQVVSETGQNNLQTVAGRDAIVQTGSGRQVVVQDGGTYFEKTERRSLADGRILVQREPEDFQRIFDDNLTVNAQKIVAPFLGKWMKLTGEVGDISVYESGTWLLTFGDFGDRLLHIFMRFDFEEQQERLSVLSRGNRITVLGRIELLESHTLRLTECELLDE